jgi:hypothetical protein
MSVLASPGPGQIIVQFQNESAGAPYTIQVSGGLTSVGDMNGTIPKGGTGSVPITVVPGTYQVTVTLGRSTFNFTVVVGSTRNQGGGA